MPARRTAILVFLLSSVAAAQVDEQRLAAEAVRKLVAHAKACERLGAIDHARRAWLEIVVEYAPDEPEVRALLGHEKVGTSWAVVDEVTAPSVRLSSRAIGRVAAAWRRTAEALGSAHLRLAEKLAGGGDADRAAHHYRRALRFRPDEAVAGRALGLESFDGAWLTDVERRTLVRGRALRQVLEILAAVEFRVQEIQGGPVREFITSAPGIDATMFRGFRGPTVEFWGVHGEGTLRAAVQLAERVQLFARAVLCDARHLVLRRLEPGPDCVFVATSEDFRTLVDVGEGDAREREFTKENLSGSWLRTEPRHVYLSWDDSHDYVMDSVARQTLTLAVASNAFAWDEGVGHAACNWFLGRSLTSFAGLVDAPTDRTSSGAVSDTDVLLPDVSVWRQLAVEQAWLAAGPDASRLMLYDASNTPSGARLRSWAFAHYLLMRDPVLFVQLDAAGSAGRADRNARVVAETFAEGVGASLDQLDRDARRHWQVDDQRLTAWRDPQPADTPAERKARGWLRSLAVARAQARLAPFGSVRGLPPRIAVAVAPAGVVDALEVERDPVELPTDDLRQQYASVCREVLVLPAADLRKYDTALVLAVPGLRDLALAREHGVVRFRADAKRTLVFVPRLPVPRQAIEPVLHPSDGARRIPREVAVERYGAFVLEALGLREGLEQLGYPLSLHLGTLPEDLDADVECQVTVDGEDVEGSLVAPAAELPLELGAPGMFVFWPHAPLPARSTVRVVWRWWPAEGGPRERAAEFQTR